MPYPSPVRPKKFISLDQNESADGLLARPERYRELEAWLASGPSVIPRGNGLSYVLCSAGRDVVSLWAARFNRIVRFDPENRTIRVESGLSIGALLFFLQARGFWFPVIPGYPGISLGGCLACNIHGKSQFHQGTFVDHVESFLLIDSSGSCRRCSRSENRELFELTAGAFGLTGLVAEMTLRVQPLKGRSLVRTRRKTRDLHESAAVMMDCAGSAEYIYSWNNLNMSAGRFGEGYVYSESFSRETRSENFRTRPMRNPPTGFAAGLNGKASFAVAMGYGCLEAIRPETVRLGVLTGTFPFNGKELYFKIFGRQGFREYQCLIPHANWSEFVTKLTTLRYQSKVTVTLGSLKIFRGQGRYLNFDGEGICLALDVPATAAAFAFFARLDQLVGSLGGIVNISKDSRLGADIVSRLFPDYGRFKALIAGHAPGTKLNSALRERLDV